MEVEKSNIEMKDQIETLTTDRDKAVTEHKTLKEKYEGNLDANIMDISEKLFKADPSAFRQTMQDLNFRGEDPAWRQADITDSMKPEEQDPAKLRAEIERLKQQNRDFAADFEKTKHMLQLQHDLETDNLRLHKEEG